MKYKTEVNIEDFLFLVRTFRSYDAFSVFNLNKDVEVNLNDIGDFKVDNLIKFKYEDISQQVESYYLTKTPFNTKIHKIDKFMVDVYKVYQSILDSEQRVIQFVDNFDFINEEMRKEIKKAVTKFKRIFDDMMVYYKYEEPEIRGIQKNYLKEKLDELVSDEEYEKAADIRDKIAIYYKLSDDFKPNSKGVEVVDHTVINDYKYGEDENPHKSYGYLRTPEMSILLNKFMTEKAYNPLAALSYFWKHKVGHFLRN